MSNPPASLKWYWRFACYFGFTLLSVIALVYGQRLDRADLGIPLGYHGDTLLILPLVKCTIETGTHWRNERLGAPGIQELYDFPIIDHVHLAILWLIGQFTPNAVYAFNLYYLAGYPLAVLAAMIVMRSFNISFAAAGLAGILYAFLPYHYIRGLGHYFLSAYWTVPLSLWPVLWLLSGRELFFSERGFTLRSRTALGALALGLMTSGAGAYYAFFTCAALSFAGVYAGLARRSWRPLSCAGITIATIVVGGIANHLPTIVYQAKYGHHSEPTNRPAEDAERYGLKLPQLLLPTQNHHWSVLSSVRARYDSKWRELQNENETATLGLLGAITFVSLIVTSVLPLRRDPFWTALSVLTLFLTLYCIVGGIGSMFNFLVIPSVRALNRLSIFMAFVIFFALARVIDRRVGNCWARWLLCLVLAIFGIWDETPRDWFHIEEPPRRQHEAEWKEDSNTFRAIEEIVPPGGAICYWPYCKYPESPPVERLDCYDYMRGYLHTRTLRWNFGAVRGREIDQWQRELIDTPAPAMLERLVFRGFDGLLIERLGFATPQEAETFVALIRKLTDNPASENFSDTRRDFFALKQFRERLEKRLGAAEYDRRRREEDSAVRVVWLDGFYGDDNREHAGLRSSAAVVINPTESPRTFRVVMGLRSSSGSAGELVIDGGSVWSESLKFSDDWLRVEREWTVPPGRHLIRFRYRHMLRGPVEDPRDTAFHVGDFTMKELSERR